MGTTRYWSAQPVLTSWRASNEHSANQSNTRSNGYVVAVTRGQTNQTKDRINSRKPKSIPTGDGVRINQVYQLAVLHIVPRGGTSVTADPGTTRKVERVETIELSVLMRTEAVTGCRENPGRDTPERPQPSPSEYRIQGTKVQPDMALEDDSKSSGITSYVVSLRMQGRGRQPQQPRQQTPGSPVG